MTRWSYRVVRRDGMLSVHETVQEGAATPTPRVRPAGPQGRDLTELRQDLERMLSALSRPVIEFDDAYPMGAQRRG